MPRKGRGGSREGAAQTAYSNRTDLNQRGPEPITVAPGQAYGEATAQREAQQAVPMAGVQTPTPQQQATPQQAPMVSPPVPGQGELDLFAPGEHHELPTDIAGPNAPVSDTSNAMRNVASVLEGAATSPYATTQVQQLAALARQLVR